MSYVGSSNERPVFARRHRARGPSAPVSPPAVPRAKGRVRQGLPLVVPAPATHCSAPLPPVTPATQGPVPLGTTASSDPALQTIPLPPAITLPFPTPVSERLQFLLLQRPSALRLPRALSVASSVSTVSWVTPAPTVTPVSSLQALRATRADLHSCPEERRGSPAQQSMRYGLLPRAGSRSTLVAGTRVERL